MYVQLNLTQLAYSSASRSCKLIFLGHHKYSYYKLMTIYGTPIWQKIEKFYLFTDHLYWLVYVHVISLHRCTRVLHLEKTNDPCEKIAVWSIHPSWNVFLIISQSLIKHYVKIPWFLKRCALHLCSVLNSPICVSVYICKLVLICTPNHIFYTIF